MNPRKTSHAPRRTVSDLFKRAAEEAALVESLKKLAMDVANAETEIRKTSSGWSAVRLFMTYTHRTLFGLTKILRRHHESPQLRPHLSKLDALLKVLQEFPILLRNFPQRPKTGKRMRLGSDPVGYLISVLFKELNGAAQAVTSGLDELWKSTNLIEAQPWVQEFDERLKDLDEVFKQK